MKNRLTDKTKDSRKIYKKEHSCPCCYAQEITVFHKLEQMPVNSVLNLKTREKALNISRGNISLGFCDNCGFIFNVAFDSKLLEYSEQYESTQSFSSTYNEFARRQAEQLIERHNLNNKDLLEIGCGNGEFLTLLCELGDNRGLGFDPAYREGRVESKKGLQVNFIKDFFSEKYTVYFVDFIYCRMTLEHIPNVAEFVGMVRQAIGGYPDAIVFFQVPDASRILRDCAFEDIYYEHCSYFSPESLAGLFRKCGFDALNLETDYDGQYAMIEARLADKNYLENLFSEDELCQLQSLVKYFPEIYQEKTSQWKNQLTEINSNGQRVVLWGSGSKGVAFLTTLDITSEVEYVVDINPHRHGTYMAGAGQKIVAPEFLIEYQPDFVIVMNAVYKDEISKNLHKMGLYPKILTL